MKTYTEMLPHIEGNDYETHFWNAIRGKQGHKEHLAKGIDTATGAFTLTPKGQEKYMTAIKQESLFRSLATDIRALVERIDVFKPEKVPGTRTKKQTILIHWNFIGAVELPQEQKTSA